MTPAATVLHNKSFLRAVATTYFSTPYVAHYCFQRACVIAIYKHKDHDDEIYIPDWLVAGRNVALTFAMNR